MRGSILFTVFLLFICSLTVSAQEYSYARYDVKDGLAGSVVYHGVEDKDGFLWFSTETGVSRFDGTHFRNFSMADGLPDNEIIKFFVDSRNRVWMMPFKNAICYYWNGKIYNQENDSLLKRLSFAGNIGEIVEDREGNLMLVEAKSIIFVNKHQQIKVIKEYNGYSILTATAALSADGNFKVCVQFFGDKTWILSFDPQGTVITKELFPYLPISNNKLFSSLHVYRKADSVVFEAKAAALSGSVAFPSAFINFSLLNDTLCSMNTGNGAFFYDLKKRKLTLHVLKGKTINWAFQDREGNHWFLTGGEGIYRVGSFEFMNYSFSENNKDYLGIFSINKFDSLLYAGSEKSFLFDINLNTRQVRSHSMSSLGINTRIMSMAEWKPGFILLGTNVGVYTMNGKGWGNTDGISIKSMQILGDSVLVSMQSGVILLLNEHSYKNFRTDMRSTCSYRQNGVYYNGTLNGLYIVDSKKNNTWLGEREVLFRSRIADMEGSSDSILWIATQSHGLIGYKDGKIVWSIRQKDGLTSDICRNVFIAANEVWVGTDKGLNRIAWRKEHYNITTFTNADGLISNIINAIHVDGSRVYVGTPAGLTTFDANKISLNSFCKLRMMGVQAMNRQLPQDTLGFTLPPRGNAIRFDYVGISYRSAGDITYRYRLVGLNDDWQTTRETFLSYPSLPSGDYELQVIATNKFGVESDMMHIPFRVEKLLWEKNWFRALILILAGAFIWLFVHTRLRKLRRQNDEKIQISNRMTELEQMALKAQMNPHFIFNSLNSVQQYVIDKDLLGANKFITEFSRLIRLTLDISSKTKISIYEEVSYLTTYLELEKTKFEDKFSYSITVSPDIDTSDWFIPPMILQPYVENSIRHGVRYRKDKEGHIRVSFSLDEHYLICQVEDNGVGRNKAGQYKSEMPIEYQSKGMSLTAKRIEMLNKNNAVPVLIEIEDLAIDNMPAGTRVILRFPLESAGRSS
ncbi:histidine kinase [Paraflavitalea soli]|uniref:Histidine kinase n=1 Tax=Paraflavitalea soli TaxID=2315862 RepID=A0A3B7MM29_9BACT|nr:sensor histidine kinase [Paraflavitalea soli]AXY74006.1 histidine kinase [Paraflavitalea soli]